jgi:hypothetical protein
MLEFLPVLMLNRFRAMPAGMAARDFKGERGGGLVTFVNSERVVPVAGITKGY